MDQHCLNFPGYSAAREKKFQTMPPNFDCKTTCLTGERDIRDAFT
jgi:hypothetical protein